MSEDDYIDWRLKILKIRDYDFKDEQKVIQLIVEFRVELPQLKSLGVETMDNC